MTYSFYGKTFNKEFLLNIIKKCDIKNKERVLGILIKNNRLLLQLNALKNLNKVNLKNLSKFNLEKLTFIFNKRIFFIQRYYIKNSFKMFFHFEKIFYVDFIKNFLIKFNFVLNQQKLQFNYNQIILLNEIYSILLEIFYEKSFYVNMTKLSSYKFDKGFMQDVLKNSDNSNFIELLNNKVFVNIVFLNRILFLLKRNLFIFNKKFKDIYLEKNNLNLEIQRNIAYYYFCFTNLFKLNLTKFKFINNKLFNTFVSFYFFINLFKRSNMLTKLESTNVLLTNLNTFILKNVYFINIFKIKYYLILLNEKLFKTK